MTAMTEDFAPLPKIDEEAIVAEKLMDAAEAPGLPIEFDPPEASLAGAVFDDVVSDEEAIAAAIDAI